MRACTQEEEMFIVQLTILQSEVGVESLPRSVRADARSAIERAEELAERTVDGLGGGSISSR